MLETRFTQGAGLHAMHVQSAPRIVAMASHDDRQSELPLLCSLCTTWTDLGYAVVVLDATMAESTSAPGLQQLLDDPASAAAGLGLHSGAWPIVPSALGLKELCRGERNLGSGRSCLQHLGRLFQDHEIILVYANAQNLSVYLPDSGIEPLLAVSTKGMSLLSAYQSLKQLLVVGRLQPTIVSVVDKSDQNSLALSSGMCKSLQDCALTFLAHQITPLSVYVPPMNGQALDDMRQLASRLLESALSLRETSLAPSQQEINGGLYFARSH